LQQATKQRIVGSIVLIALALIFLPIVFDGQGSYDTQIASRIPDVPIIKPFSISQPSRPVIQSNQPDFDAQSVVTEPIADPSPGQPELDAGAVSESLQETVAAVVTSEPAYVRTAPEIGPDGLPTGWSVRLATFSDNDNATTLLDRLLDAGYKGYSRALKREQGELTAVYVGPWLDRARVDQTLQELQSQFNLAGIVERYTIEPL
jgi:DedD protein